jgi:hypothetical protein
MTDSLVTSSTPIAAEDATPPVQGPQYREAYQRALPAAQALPLGELITINIDVPTAVTTVVGKLPQIRALRGAIVDALPKFDFANAASVRIVAA